MEKRNFWALAIKESPCQDIVIPHVLLNAIKIFVYNQIRRLSTIWISVFKYRCYKLNAKRCEKMRKRNFRALAIWESPSIIKMRIEKILGPCIHGCIHLTRISQKGDKFKSIKIPTPSG